MIARQEHKEKAKQIMHRKKSGMIGVNALTTFFAGAATVTVGTSVLLLLAPVILVVFSGAIAGIVSTVGYSDFGFGGFDIYGLITALSLMLTLVGSLVGIALSFIGILQTALTGVADCGNKRYYLALAQNKGADPKVTVVLDGFNDFLGVFAAYFMQALIILLWQIPFIIGGALLGMIPVAGMILRLLCTIASFVIGWYKHYEYWAVPYVKAERPKTDAKSCLEISKQICHDHIADLLVLDLSFLGWRILNGITAGLVGFFYYTPYLHQTFALVYGELKGSVIEIDNEISSMEVSAGITPDDVQRMIDTAVKCLPQPKPQSQKAGIFGLTGEYSNTTMELKAGQTIILGHDASKSNVVLSNAPHVSGKHCSISYVSATDSYEVIDYSSNGTLANGERIPKGVPVSLPRGSKLSLADDSNSFRLM